MEMEVPAAVEADPRAARLPWPCTMCDVQVVHKLAQLLLPGLATACVHSSSSATALVELRKEMVVYITHRSISQTDQADDPAAMMTADPAETVALFLDDFVSSKSSILAGWGWGWLLGGEDSREDRVDDLVQEMEAARFWPIQIREAVAATLLRNLGLSHCRDRLETPERLAEHESSACGFRPVRCRNHGCRAEVSARRAEEHDEVCPFKVLPCEQRCGDLAVTRREMDRHCVTTCPTRLTNCPFYQVGCESAFPGCSLQSHCAQFLRTHLLLLLDHDDERLMRLEKCDSHGTLVKAMDVRSLTNALGELEKRLGADDDDALRLHLQI